MFPFADDFLRRLENRKRWEVEWKIFSEVGFIAVITMDIMVMMAYIG